MAFVFIFAFVWAKSASIRSSCMLIVALIIFSFEHTLSVKPYIIPIPCQGYRFTKKDETVKKPGIVVMSVNISLRILDAHCLPRITSAPSASHEP